jgi:hypothetical protein
MGKSKCISTDEGLSMASSYNAGFLVDGGFNKEQQQGQERMLYATAIVVGHELGMSSESALVMTQFLGNRRCLGCPMNRRGDVMKGNMYCRTCSHQGAGQTLRDQLKVWLLRSFNEKTYNFTEG